jgi:hypothetical protein
MWGVNTAVPSVNYDCGNVPPSGYLVKTPSPAWLLHCGRCIKNQSWGGWGGNPLSNSTPTPEVTPTPTQIPNETTYHIHDYFLYSNLIPHNEVFDSETFDFGNSGGAIYILDTDTNDENIHYFGSFNIKAEGHHHPTFVTGGWGFQTSIRFQNYGTRETHCIYREGSYVERVGGTHYDLGGQQLNLLYLGSENLMVAYGLETQDFTWKVDVTMDCEFRGSAGGVLHDLYFGIYNGGAYITDLTTIEGSLKWSETPLPDESNPTPTPGPGYCQNIDDGNTEVPTFPFMFYTGQATCLSIGGWSISLTWLQVFFPQVPESVTLPGIEFCFLPIIFGNLQIFGLSINLDLLAQAMAAVLLFRFVTNN